jgi:NADH pyrophosphatase NudC (nudix superfamily)
VAVIGDRGAVTEHRGLVSTEKAAAELDVDRTTLFRWYQRGDVTPAVVTPSGHLRWDLNQLRAQLAANKEDRMPEPLRTPLHPTTDPEDVPVAAAIVTSHLGVLAGRRWDNRPPWTLIAGEVEPGESVAHAAEREVKEEAALEVRAGEYEIGRRIHPATQRLMIYVACAPTTGTDVYVGDPDELAEVRWLGLREVDELMPGMFAPVRQHLGRVLNPDS